VAFGWPVTVAVASLVPQLVGQPPGLTAEGVRLRRRPWQRRLVTIPWSEITLLWIGYRGSRAYLCVAADPRGPHADEWDPHGRRFTRAAQPLAVYLPDLLPPDRVRAGVAALSRGTVTVADRGPDQAGADGPDDDAWADLPTTAPAFDDQRRSVPAVALAALLVGALVGVPAVLGVAPPWNQPWWPTSTVAAKLPDACGVLNDEQATALGVTDRHRLTDEPRRQVCDLTVPQGQLRVSLEAFHALFGSSSVKAGKRFDELSAAMANGPRRLPGVGDEAWLVANEPGTTTYIDRAVVRIVARRANVVLVMIYGGEREPEVAQDAVIGAARDTLARLDVR